MKMKIKRKSMHRALIIVGFVIFLVAGFQNCMSGSDPFDINSNSSAGVINNTTQITGNIALGSFHSCAIASSTGVYCWGEGGSGQLGNGNNTNEETAVAVSGITGAVKVVAGYAFTCAMLSSGLVSCWGDNSYGQLGNNTQTSSYNPVTAYVETNKVFDIATVYQTTCVVLRTGTVQCWGRNTNGELGDNDSSTTYSLTPVDVYGINNAVAITGGFDHFCALLSSGTIECWGSNTNGQLGNGTTGGNSILPVAVTSLPIGATQVAGGTVSTCAVMVDTSVQCWGDNTYGELGNGSDNASTMPVPVTGLVGAKYVAVGYYAACATLTSGATQCWGYNDLGELGNNSLTNSDTAVTVSGVSGASAVGFGYYHACAYISGSSVKCWGYNSYGQLGNNSLNNSETAVTVQNF